MHNLQIPLGSYHPLMKDPEHFKIYLQDGKIVDTDLFIGYNHRGIEKLAEMKTYDKLPYLIERICGICSNAHSSAISRAVENAAGIEPNKKARYIRSVVAELERIQSHLLWFGTQSHSLGFDELFKDSLTCREHPLDLLEKISGSRIHYGLSEFGGTKKDITPEKQGVLKKELGEIRALTEAMKEDFSSNEQYTHKLENIGVLSKKKAGEIGVVGPVAKASGINLDMRLNGVNGAYSEIDFEAITRKKGDCLSRTEVRLDDIIQSIEIIEQLLPIPKGKHRGKGRIEIDEPIKTIGRAEAPRGENFHYLHAGKKKPLRLRIRPPTYANFMCLHEMAMNGKIADAPAIVISIDPCFNCTDRMCVIDLDENTEKVRTFHEIVEGKDKDA